MNQSTINTVLFDLDGTLINTNELIIASFQHTLDHYYPGQYSREDILHFIGPSLFDTFSAMDPNLTDDMIQMYRTFNHEQHDLLVTEYETVLDTLKILQDRGFKLGIVTTKIRDTVLMGLKLTGLEPFLRSLSHLMMYKMRSRIQNQSSWHYPSSAVIRMRRSWLAITITTFYLVKRQGRKQQVLLGLLREKKPC